MGRTYKPKPGHKQYKKYDPQILKNAIQELRNGNGSLKKIGMKYKITTSVLQRHYHKMNMRMSGAQTAFSLEREEHIIKYINACAPWEYYLTPWDIRLLMKCYLDKRPVISKRKFVNNLPGQDLVTNLLKRHKDAISHRIIQNTQNNGTITVEAVLSYFHELKMSIAEVSPENIVCYKDILLTDDKEKNLTDASKPNDILVMTAASASGDMLPCVIYKQQNCYDIRKRTKSIKQPYPRLSANIFEDWFKSIILPYYEGKPGKKCLISGYFTSRISIDLLEICRQNNIDLVFLPHNSSNLTHPLDTLSELIHTRWNELLFQWKKDGSESENVERSFRTILQDLTNSSTEEILQGFNKTGINPINQSEVLKQLPDYNETTVENVDEEFEKLENVKNSNIELVQVKEEMEWNNEYNDVDDDEEIACINSQIKPFKAKGKINKSENDGTQKIEWRKTESERNLIGFDLKLSPVDFQNDISEDASVDHITDYTFRTNGPTKKNPKESEYKRKIKGISPCPNENEMYCTQENEKIITPSIRKSKPSNLDEEILLADSEDITETDPLLNCQNGTHLQPTFTTSTSETPSRKRQCENGCNTHTRLLEAILSSATRQEKWQERTVRAMEAQTRALDNIARVLEGWVSGNSTKA